jgi:hypothetical protein
MFGGGVGVVPLLLPCLQHGLHGRVNKPHDVGQVRQLGRTECDCLIHDFSALLIAMQSNKKLLEFPS